MCGLAGILDFHHPIAPASLETMIATLAHRGPDGHGVRADGPVGLAHSRLSIIDLAGGHQPLSNEDGRIWVVFNGEIFNHIELRAQLEARGHRFATHSDTEVLVHLYEEHGADFVRHLNGQFAIALWDGHRQQLTLARDPTGIRPLYYTRVGQRLLWASEVKALLTQPGVTRELSRPDLHTLFSWWAVAPGRSVFRDIASLPPGHVVTVAADTIGQALRPQRYWDWAFPEQDGPPGLRPQPDIDVLARELRARLSDAVRLQLRADVPVGAYLSGGLDSSIIASLIKQHAPDQLRTFSLTFEDSEFDESAHQAAMAQHLGTAHSSVRCSKTDIARLFGDAVWLAESPVVRTAPAPMLMLARHVRESGYKVVLTGEGADEVFAGYDLFREARVRRFMARQPQSATRPRLLERLYPYLQHSPVATRAMTQRFFAEGAALLGTPGFGHLPRWTTSQRITQLYSADMREAAHMDRPALDGLRDMLGEAVWQRLQRLAPQHQDQYIEAHTLMSGYLLSSQGDRMAMGASIEGRYPFLDHQLIEWANQLPTRYTLQGLDEKHLLKRAFADVLPAQIVGRTKQPYRAPDSASFVANGQLVDSAAALLAPEALRQAGYFDAEAAQRLVAKCVAGKAQGFGDNMAFVGMLSTQWLHHRFIDSLI